MPIKKSNNLKALQVELNKLQKEVGDLNNQKKLLTVEINSRNESIQKVKGMIEKLKKKTELLVSEHAILRFIERELGIDLKEIEKKILHPDIVEQHKILGNAKYPIPDTSCKAIIKNNIVVIIKPKK